MSDPDKILILDAITFSGNTLKVARKEVQKWYPKATVQCGVLVVSQQLLTKDKQELIKDFGKIDFAQETDRFEIFFPWGVTQTTASLTRRFPTIDGTREVQIMKRDWGAMELLAHDELCSTRLLVIEAGNKLSFQRHLCRDELYVALDDNIGLKIAGFLEGVGNVDKYDPQIQSLILERGDYVLIPRGVWHRPEASMDRVRILEIAFGVYDQVNDIERIGDEYGRERRDGAR